MPNIIVSKSAGFCFGVSRSVNMAEEILAKGKNAVSYGELIHNEDVLNSLSLKGLSIIHSPSEIERDSVVIIRAHGVSAAEEEALKLSGAEVCDATCPRVKKIHSIVEEATKDGRFVIIIGSDGHPEVEGIKGRCGKSVAMADETQLVNWLEDNDIFSTPVSVVAQTTQNVETYRKCCASLKKRCTNIIVSDTICFATFSRQKDAAELASVCDAMVVIGGYNSANSIRLAQICAERCSNVQFIRKCDELNLDLLLAADTIGITAGASTPAWIIKEVRNKMDEIKVEEVELSFDEMLENSLKPIYNGDKVAGRVEAITPTEISVDLGAKYSGFIPASEFTDDNIKVEDVLNIGDTVEAIVIRVNDVEGTAQLSKKRLDIQKNWIAVEEALESGAILEGTVTEENKGGVVVNLKGIRVFIPASQTDLPRNADLRQLLNNTVRLQIIEVNKARKRVVGSIKRVAQAERRLKSEAIWNEIEAGKRYNGVVKSLTSYGAFVDIGGIDGMVHVSELSWGRVKHPSEIVSVGEFVEVYVISFDREKRKISLGYKDPNADPWKLFTSKYAVGDVASVTIVKLMAFGAFAEIVPGVDGLIHISQLANHHVEKVEDAVKPGDLVNAKITAVDEENHKVSLSIRALGLQDALPEEKDYAEDASEE